MTQMTDGSTRMVTGHQKHDWVSPLTMMSAIGINAALIGLFDQPWWVGSLAGLATLAAGWAITSTINRRRTQQVNSREEMDHRHP